MRFAVAVKPSLQPISVQTLVEEQPAPTDAAQAAGSSRSRLSNCACLKAYAARPNRGYLPPCLTSAPWPELRIAAWRDTYATLLLYAQIVGKIRLALAPKMNQWWNVTLYVTARGLTTSPMPYGDRLLSIDFDFIDHRLLDPGQRRQGARAAARGEAGLLLLRRRHERARRRSARPSTIWPQPQECPVTTPFPDDREHAHYDRAAVQAYWQALRRIEPVFQQFRSRFRGKCSPVHFFWGAFDLAVTRFVGRRAPARKAKVDRDAYDEEVISLGFWPGDPWATRRHRGAVLLVHRARAGRPVRRVRSAPPRRAGTRR